jgi:hypothetical protein
MRPTGTPATTTVSVIAPKGGQGATTVAATLALLAAPDGTQWVLCVSDDAAAILGDPRGRTEPCVSDDHRQLTAAKSRPPRWNGDVQIIDGPPRERTARCWWSATATSPCAKPPRRPGRGSDPTTSWSSANPAGRSHPAATPPPWRCPPTAVTIIDADPSVARSVDAGLLARPGLSRSLGPLRALSPGANKPPLGTRTPGIDPPVRAALARVDAPTPQPPETGGLQR